MATKIDGKATQATVLEEIRRDTEELRAKTGVQPGLVVMLVGDDPASSLYVSNKEKACKEVGFYSLVDRIPADTTEADLIRRVEEHCANPKVHGLILQLPLPNGLAAENVIQKIDPNKDVDGLTATSIGNLVLGSPCFIPCTPKGVMELLHRHGVSTVGKHVVVVGRSQLVGKPIANVLLQKSALANATVTVVHSATIDLGKYTRQADILIVAAGNPNTIKAEDVREGCVIIDVGMNRIADPMRKSGYRFVGDVEPAAYAKSTLYTPVPGGVGPMTVAMLLKNTLESATRVATASNV